MKQNNLLKIFNKFFLLLILIIAKPHFTKAGLICPAPSIFTYPAYFTDNLIRINFNVCCNPVNTYIIEYGAPGFSPGNDSSAGTGGTVVNFYAATGSYDITSLQPHTYYDFYMRIKCFNGGWSSNSTPITRRTMSGCNNMNSFIVGSPISFTLPADSNTWYLSSNINSQPYASSDKIYSIFIPQTGTYQFAFSCMDDAVAIAYKQANVACVNSSSWNFLTNSLYTNNLGTVTLQGGTTYHFLFLANTLNATAKVYFYLKEIGSCLSGINSMSFNPTFNSVKFNYPGYSTNDIIEYGIGDNTGLFLPGKALLPGNIFGVIQNVPNDSTLYNLQPNSFYYVYIRKSCGNNLYSKDSIGFWFSTPYCPADYGPFLTDITYSVFMFQPVGQSPCGYAGNNIGAIFSFTSSSTDTIQLALLNGNNYNLGWKKFDGSCNANTFSCIYPDSTSPNCMDCTQRDYYFLPMEKDSTYDFFINQYDNGLGGYQDVTFNYPTPLGIFVDHVTPYSATINWSNKYCSDTILLEYGLAGFTPGMFNSPGVGGTLFNAVYSPFAISGLLADTNYDIYMRTAFDGHFGKNIKYYFKTQQDCNQADTLEAGTIFSFRSGYYDHYDTLPAGAWNSTACNSNNKFNATENFYQFIPVKNCMASIFIFYASGTFNCGFAPATFYYKEKIGTCSDTGWTCIGNIDFTNIYEGDTLFFGPLDSGSTYLIAIDGFAREFGYNQCSNYLYGLRLDADYFCPVPIDYFLKSISPDTVVIQFPPIYSLNGDVYLEYGKVGFTPGIDSLPGPGGTMIHPVSDQQIITGFLAGDTIDVYTRQICNSSLGFSNNAPPLTFTPCSSPPTGINTSKGTNLVCKNEVITLYRQGGELVAGAQFAWYADSCNGTLLGYGDSITILIPKTTAIFVRAESPCGNSSCFSFAVLVSNNPKIMGDSLVCPGDSAQLYYSGPAGGCLWSNGKTYSPMYVHSAGSYFLTVTDYSGCILHDSIVLTPALNPQPVIAGNNFFCNGDSLILDAGSGYHRYYWSNGSSLQYSKITGPGKITVTVYLTNYGCQGKDSLVISKMNNPVPNISGPLSLCTGGSIHLDAGLYNSYLWSNGETTRIATITIPGLVTVEVTDTASCQGNDSVFIGIQNNLQPVITGPVKLCPGGSGTLETTQKFYSYLWSNGSVSDSIVISNAGTYSIIVADSIGCIGSDSVNIGLYSVNQPLISGDTILCQGQTSILTVSPAFSIYLWSTGSTNNIINVTNAGIYSITVTDFHGCIGNSLPLVIQVMPTPIISLVAYQEFCEGDTINLDPGGPYSNYLWSNGFTTQVIQAYQTGTYIVTVSDSNSCQSVDSSHVLFHAVPSANIIMAGTGKICVGDSVLIYGGNHPGIFYQWYFNNTPINYATSYLLYAKNQGIYHLVLTDAYGCSRVSPTKLVLVSCIRQVNPLPPYNQRQSLYHEKSITFNLIPNPVNGNTVTLEYEIPGNEKAVFILFDSYGRKALLADLEPGNNSRFIQIPNLKNGLYNAVIQTSWDISRKSIMLLR